MEQSAANQYNVVSSIDLAFNTSGIEASTETGRKEGISKGIHVMINTKNWGDRWRMKQINMFMTKAAF